MKKNSKVLMKILSFVLIFSMFFTPLDSVSYAAGETRIYSDGELARAVSYGIGTYRADNPTVTYKQFFLMLDGAVKKADASKLKKWKTRMVELRKSNGKMTRFSGMMATFLAAEALGGEYMHFTTDWYTTHEKIGEPWNGIRQSPVFSRYYGKKVAFDGNKWSYDATAYFYSFGRTSLFSNKTIFEYDPRTNSMRPNDAFTYEEALGAAIRLLDSNLKPTERIPTKEDAAILQRADERRTAIHNTETTITVKGTAYYVSNSGNDNNDGKSPEAAWATVEKVNSMTFEVGDGVFFQRGGLWREKMRIRDNITYSAYGEGKKPKFYGSPENGAAPEKWRLLEGTKNIWVFYKELYDTGGIVFNEGKSWATRKTAIWDGIRYVEVVDKKTPIDVKKLDNLKFFSATDYTGCSLKEASRELDRKGKLYLRCDAGNPGKVYESIEFLSNRFETGYGGTGFIIQTNSNCMLDNLCLMYGNAGGFGVGSNTTVQNCEIGWMGGNIMNFNGAWLGTDSNAVIRCGDGIQFLGGENGVATNNYVHHIYDNAITIETVPSYEGEFRFEKNITISGNLVEASSGDMLVADWHALQMNEENNVLFQNIRIEDNYFMNSGYGWSHLEPDYDWGNAGAVNNGNCNIFFAFPAKSGKDLLVKNNVFYRSKYALVGGKYGGEGQSSRYQITFEGNTYVQTPFGILVEWPPLEGFRLSKTFRSDFYSRKTIEELLGDKTGTVLE